MKIINKATRLPIAIALIILTVSISFGIYTSYSFFNWFGISLFTVMVSICFIVNYISYNKTAKWKFLKFLPYVLGVPVVIQLLFFVFGTVAK